MSRVAWVTGGGTGIGKALATALCAQGYQVVISGRRADVLKQAAAEINAGESLLVLPGDVSQAADVERIAAAIRARWGDVDLLINNAGANPYHSFQEAPPEEFVDNFRVNCLSAILCAKSVLPAMLSRRGGAIVNVSSVLGKWASANSPAYSVSKYALAGFTDSLRQDFRGSGVHVMGVYPGYIQTPMTQPFVTPGSARARLGKSPEAMAAAILKGLKRKKRDVQYPWYVPWALHLHHLFPGLMEKFRGRF